MCKYEEEYRRLLKENETLKEVIKQQQQHIETIVEKNAVENYRRTVKENEMGLSTSQSSRLRATIS